MVAAAALCADASAAAAGERPAPQQPGAPGAAEEGAAGVLHFNYRGQREAARAATATLVLALADDPVNAYFSGKRRRRFCKDEVKAYLKALPGATNFIATPDMSAVALWQLLPLETPRNELWAGWTRIFKVPPRLWRQLLRLELRYEAAHEALEAEVGPYYYLSFIGTHPAARGRGEGGRLLRAITRRADAERRWCLLEATSERSQALYARHGFATFEAFRVAPGAPPVFLMRRAPGAEEREAAAAPAREAAPLLSAAALQLAAAVAAKVGAAPRAPASECGSAASSLIGATMVVDGSDSEDDEEEEDGEEEEEEEQGRAGGGATAAGNGRGRGSSGCGCSSGGGAAAPAGAQAARIVVPPCAIVVRAGRESSSRAGAGGPMDAGATA